jgi:aspartyl/asparaginyl beta-hydroxylase (cupin superfamily)
MQNASAALSARDSQGALGFLAEVERAGLRHPEVQHLKGVAFHQMNNLAQAIAAYDAALIIEPYYLPSILYKGAALDDAGRKAEALAIWRNALKVAPSADKLPPPIAEIHARARARVDDENRRLHEFLLAEVDGARAKYGASELKRFNESLDIFSGLTRAFVHEPTMLHFPALPSVSFFDRTQFSWFERLEAATDVIIEELLAVLASPAAAAFAPYVVYAPGTPVNQWGELNHSRRWTSFFFYCNGVRQAGACNAAPRTASLLRSLPLLDVDSFGPTAMFSSLAAKTRIPPHTGSTNVRAIIHLPLILPGPAWFRVGNDRREWRMGEAWAFDDTIEHEAMNESPETRVILICDTWNPYLTEPERALVGAMLQAKSVFQTRAGGRAERFT